MTQLNYVYQLKFFFERGKQNVTTTSCRVCDIYSHHYFFGSLHFTAPFRLKVHLLLITITTFGLVKKAISGGPSNKNTYIHTQG